MSNTFTRDPQPRIQYSGDGSRTTFGFPFPVLAGDDLLVFVNDTPATGFAISGLTDPAGGEIDFIDPPAAGTSITLLRRTEGIRETEFVDGGPFRAAAINAELDRIMLLIQENREEHKSRVARPPGRGGNRFLPASDHGTRQSPPRLRQRGSADSLRRDGAAVERRCQRRPGDVERWHHSACAG